MTFSIKNGIKKEAFGLFYKNFILFLLKFYTISMTTIK